MSGNPSNGTIERIDGETRIFFDGYWIKYYEPPADSLQVRWQLIQALTRRLFNHVEHGLNIPGLRLDEARAAYEAETNLERKRVNGAMLAGALFNRAIDTFRALVDLQAAGLEIPSNHPLMRECGRCLTEALELGKMVRHRSGHEGIDELWGEPFKAFVLPISAFYESRYVKIAATMADIDRIAAAMKTTFEGSRQIIGIGPRIDQLVRTAQRKCEILRTDRAVFRLWPEYVVASERISDVEPLLPHPHGRRDLHEAIDGKRLLREGIKLVSFIVRARVPMPKSTREYIDRCRMFRRAYLDESPGLRAAGPVSSDSPQPEVS